MQKTLSIAAVVLMAASLGACADDENPSGDSSAADYCSILKDTKEDLDTLDFAALDEEKFADLQSKISVLKDAAPSEVQGDWTLLGDGIGEFKSILDEAGISLDDLQTLQSGEVPDGVDIQKLQEIGPKMEEVVSGTEIEDATKSIQDHAKAECDITLDESTGP